MSPRQSNPVPPKFVSGGRRLNFDREDGWGSTARLDDTFRGYGKDDGCYPSCTWEELCAMAALIVAHPAYVEPGEEAKDPIYGASIEEVA